MKEREKGISYILLGIFIALSGMSFFSAPAKPLVDEHSYSVFLGPNEADSDHSLIRPIFDSEELQVRSTPLVFISYSGSFHTVVSNLKLAHIRQLQNLDFPKERLYLLNSKFII